MNEPKHEEGIEPPEPESALSEYGTAGATGLLGAIPVVGDVLGNMLEVKITSVFERRVDEWRRRITDAISLLDRRVGDVEVVLTDEQFASTVVQASQVAMRTHREEKWEALRNAIVAAGLPDAPEEYFQRMFIRFVDELEPIHLQLLKVLDDPEGWFDVNEGLDKPQFAISSSIARVIESAIPELADRRDIYDRLGSDLSQRGLAQGDFHSMMSESGAWVSRTTEFGKAFLGFISDQ